MVELDSGLSDDSLFHLGPEQAMEFAWTLAIDDVFELLVNEKIISRLFLLLIGVDLEWLSSIGFGPKLFHYFYYVGDLSNNYNFVNSFIFIILTQ